MMGRQRKPENAWLPKYTRVTKGRYVFTPYLGKGKRGKEIALGKVGDARWRVLKAYEELIEQDVQQFTIKWALDYYNTSPRFEKLSPKTQKEYLLNYRTLVNTKIKGGKLGDVLMADLTPPAVKRYLLKRAEENASISANKEIGYLSSAWNWVRQCEEDIPVNPCFGVERNPKPPRQHYVEDQDYYAVLNHSWNVWYMRPLMEVLYLCRMRKAEALDLRVSDILDKGLLTRRAKGSKTSITLWTQRLKKAVDSCLAQKKRINAIDPNEQFLFSDEYNKPLSVHRIDGQWHRFMRKYDGVRFRWHDLKRKGVSDFEGDKLKASGHRSPNMLRIYDVKPDEVEGTR